jgi:hypothetical protein
MRTVEESLDKLLFLVLVRYRDFHPRDLRCPHSVALAFRHALRIDRGEMADAACSKLGVDSFLREWLSRVADGPAVAVATSLPWSMRATGIVVRAWCVAVTDTRHGASRREVPTAPRMTGVKYLGKQIPGLRGALGIAAAAARLLQVGARSCARPRSSCQSPPGDRKPPLEQITMRLNREVPRCATRRNGQIVCDGEKAWECLTCDLRSAPGTGFARSARRSHRLALRVPPQILHEPIRRNAHPYSTTESCRWSVSLKSCRLFGQDHATEQMLRAKS